MTLRINPIDAPRRSFVARARMVVVMDEVPGSGRREAPPDAFEPRPEPSEPPPEAFERQPDETADPGGGNRLRWRLRVALALLIVAAIVVLAAIEGGGYIIRGDAVQAPTLAQGSRLAVVDVAGTLTTIDRTGGGVVTYAPPDTTFQFPAWSPDGSRIAAIGAGPDGTGIYVFVARAATDPSTEPAVIYKSANRPPFYLFWGPDSRQITFLTTEPDGLALRIAPADASTADSIVRSGAPMYWDFADAGNLLVHSGLSGPAGFLGEVGLDGAVVEGTAGTPGVFRAPAVSRDGRYRAFVAAGDGVNGQVVVQARGAADHARAPVFGPAALSFGPVGDQLAFIGPDQASSNTIPLPVGPLRVLDPAVGEPRTLLGGSVVAFLWSPTGTEIAVFSIETPGTVTEASERGIVLASSSGGAPTAAAGVDLRLAFVEVADGSIRSERTVRLSDLFVNQVLPFFDQYALSHRFWSPDGTAIVLPVVGDGDVTKLWVIPADGTDAVAVATAEMGFWSP
jgi:TolB protein